MPVKIVKSGKVTTVSGTIGIVTPSGTATSGGPPAGMSSYILTSVQVVVATKTATTILPAAAQVP